MILLKFIIVFGVFISNTHADCPIAQDPRYVIECLGYITRGIYGAAMKDLQILCSVARDVANCTQQQLVGCIAAEVGQSVLNEVTTLAAYCCPERNDSSCPIRDEILDVQRCFSADSLVTLANGKEKLISELQSGDKVLAYNDKTKKILSTDIVTMLDKQSDQLAIFKQLTTKSGKKLSLTSSHLLLTDTHDYIMAKDIHIGMNIYIMNDQSLLILESIVNVVDVIKRGYVAPLTEEGTLIVNNIAASCYATIHNHHLAHAVLAPMRWWYKLFAKMEGSDEIIGIHWFPKMIYDITKFFIPSFFS